jgi:hypothetical protein
MSGRSPSTRIAALSNLARGEQERRGPHHLEDLRGRAVGVLRRRECGQHVIAGVLSPVLDVVADLLVGPLQGILTDPIVVECPDLCVVHAERHSELLVVLLWDPEQVGDDQQREGSRIRRQELAPAVGDELVDVSIGQPPHEVLVLLQPLWGEQPG